MSSRSIIPTKLSKFKNQVVHKQKVKDPISSTCQISSERRVLTWNQRLIRDPGFFCFHVVKLLMLILALLAMLCVCEKLECK